MMINANKKMVVVYMKENPAAGKIEVFFEDIFRNESFNEAAQELFEALGTIYAP